MSKFGLEQAFSLVESTRKMINFEEDARSRSLWSLIRSLFFNLRFHIVITVLGKRDEAYAIRSSCNACLNEEDTVVRSFSATATCWMLVNLMVRQETSGIQRLPSCGFGRKQIKNRKARENIKMD